MEKKNSRKMVGGQRLFQVKGLPAFENNSHARTVNMVLYCLNIKALGFSGPNLCFHIGFIYYLFNFVFSSTGVKFGPTPGSQGLHGLI